MRKSGQVIYMKRDHWLLPGRSGKPNFATPMDSWQSAVSMRILVWRGMWYTCMIYQFCGGLVQKSLATKLYVKG
ncbi:hypothetical protein TWF281_002462 [Arthrobotrys megalospora]